MLFSFSAILDYSLTDFLNLSRHRDAVTHCVATKTDFIVTASCDGHLKFWKKQDGGIEFVKHFRAHLGNIQGLAANVSGTLL